LKAFLETVSVWRSGSLAQVSQDLAVHGVEAFGEQELARCAQGSGLYVHGEGGVEPLVSAMGEIDWTV